MMGTRKKGRVIFLAAIMVVSVFGMTAAFAGSAAAQRNGEEITVDNRSDLEANITGYISGLLISLSQSLRKTEGLPA